MVGWEAWVRIAGRVRLGMSMRLLRMRYKRRRRKRRIGGEVLTVAGGRMSN